MSIFDIFKSNEKISYNEKSAKYNDNKTDRKNRIIGSLIGGAIGDALGYQIEFKRNIKEKEVTPVAVEEIIKDLQPEYLS